MQWLNDHLDFNSNPFFLGTDSYSGILAPIIAQEIIDGNVNKKCYVLKSNMTYCKIEAKSYQFKLLKGLVV